SVESVSSRRLGIVTMAIGALISASSGWLPLMLISVLDLRVDDPTGNQGQRKDDQPKPDRLGARHSNGSDVVKQVVVDQEGNAQGRFQRSARGHDEHLVEDLEAADDPERDDQENDRAKEWDRDAEQLAHPTGSVNRGRLV